MALTPDEIKRLTDRAQEVGRKVGLDMQFVVAPNAAYVGLTAGPDRVLVIGPDKLVDFAAHDIDLELDALERGDRRIVMDEDGDPRLV